LSFELWRRSAPTIQLQPVLQDDLLALHFLLQITGRDAEEIDQLLVENPLSMLSDSSQRQLFIVRGSDFAYDDNVQRDVERTRNLGCSHNTPSCKTQDNRIS